MANIFRAMWMQLDNTLNWSTGDPWNNGWRQGHRDTVRTAWLALDAEQRTDVILGVADLTDLVNFLSHVK